MDSSTSRRYGHIDALKGAGILLVVFGHLIEKPSAVSTLLQVVYTGIYSFHMPLFVFLSGIFAREALKSRDYQKIVWTLFFPLVVFQFIYLGVAQLTGWYSYSPFTPYWLLWFIASLIGWRILLPLFASPAGLAVAVLGAVFVGYDDAVGYALSAARTIYFLPFFVLGHLYGLQLVALARRRRLAFSGLFVLSMLIVTVWWANGLDGSALTGSHDYDSAPPFLAYPGLGRFLVLSLSLAGVLGFCALVPAGATILQWFGERSMSIYLLHGLAVMVLVSAGAAGLIPQPLLLPVLAGAALLMAAATAMLDGSMRRLFSPPADSFDMVGLITDWRRSR
ncbi:MAG: acyltransferase family protein, partial [Hyphomicrobiales bacterium]|nr:acyltransferase family protein [Hyphomicrobiales bacterium]